MDLMTDLNHKGTTIIMVTHDPNIAAYSKRTIRITDGRIAL
jgi:putative ABC transport system ATP-binding protein